MIFWHGEVIPESVGTTVVDGYRRKTPFTRCTGDGAEFIESSFDLVDGPETGSATIDAPADLIQRWEASYAPGRSPTR